MQKIRSESQPSDRVMRQFIHRLAPDPETLRRHPSLRWFQHWLHDPNLWHFNRYSVSSAVFIGFLICFAPLPIHMAAATLAAIAFRANLPTAVAATWLSNPVTLPLQFYAAYQLGTGLLQQPRSAFTFELSMHWVGTEFAALWQPLLLGCLLCGLSAATIGWLAVRIGWRLQVSARWRARQRQRAAR